jgi:geranylgeranyl pyrophosphate synthase
MSIEKRLEHFKTQFEPELAAGLERHIPNQLGDLKTSIKQYVLNGGKRLRPFIVSSMMGGTRDQIEGVIDALVAFEILHNSTLVDDDIIDDHQLRRDAPTLPAVMEDSGHERNSALLLAAILHSIGIQIIINSGLPEGLKKECVSAYNKIYDSVNLAQIDDIKFRNNLDIDEESLIRQAEGVAARFIEQMFRIGAYNTESQETWGEVGLHMGIVFQLFDDLMDIDVEKNKGRRLGDDIREGKMNPLSLYAFNNCDDWPRFKANFGNLEIADEELDWMIQAYNSSGAVLHVKDLIKDRISRVTGLLEETDVTNDHWIYEFIKYSQERVN